MPNLETRGATIDKAKRDADEISLRMAGDDIGAPRVYRANRSDVEILRNHVRKLIKLLMEE